MSILGHHKNNKIFIFGIDGGTFDIIKPLVHRGDLPNIASLLKVGANSELASTVPPITAPAWVSFMTGKNPGKHGIFHFIGHTHDSYSGKILSASDIKAKSLWSILSEHGKKLILINIPITFPPKEINGILIPGIGTPPDAQSFTYPQGIYDELLYKIGDYKVDYWDERVFNDSNPSKELIDELIENLNYMTLKRTEAALYLTKEYQWDLCMVVYVLTDRLQHLLWGLMDERHPGHDLRLARHFKESIWDGYKKVDEAMGTILREIGDDVSVIVMSDHGFGPLYKSFFVNNWLLQKGFLKLRRTVPWRLQVTRPSVQRILSKLRLGFLTGFFPEKVNRFSVPKLKMVPKRWADLIDWTKTKVYAADTLGVSINMKGREPHGIIGQGEEFEALLQKVEEELYSLRDPETGELVVDEVARKEKVYSGQYTGEAADLLFAMKDLSYLPYPGRIDSKMLFGKPANNWSGTHRFNGILILKDPRIKRDFTLSRSSILDIAPTILYLFGLPVPKDMDGCVLGEAFFNQVLDEEPVVFSEVKNLAEGVEEDRSAKEEEQVRKHLANLGYL